MCCGHEVSNAFCAKSVIIGKKSRHLRWTHLQGGRSTVVGQVRCDYQESSVSALQPQKYHAVNVWKNVCDENWKLASLEVLSQVEQFSPSLSSIQANDKGSPWPLLTERTVWDLYFKEQSLGTLTFLAPHGLFYRLTGFFYIDYYCKQFQPSTDHPYAGNISDKKTLWLISTQLEYDPSSWWRGRAMS